MQSTTALPPTASADGRTLGAVLRKRAAEQPADLAYVFVSGSARREGRPLAYSRLDRQARAFAAHLGEVAPPGSRVLLVFPHGGDLAGGFFGCLLAGMVAVPLPMPVAGDAGSVPPALEACRPELLLTRPEWAGEWRGLESVRVAEADGLRVGGAPTSRLAEHWRPVGVMPNAPAYLRYRPGESAEAVFTHADLLATLFMLSSVERLGLGMPCLSWLAGVHGLAPVWRLLLPVYQGRTAWIDVT